MLASQGARTSARHASSLLHHQAGAVPGSSRGLHIPSFTRVHPRIPNLGQTQKLFSQSRHIVTRFFNLLTAPGLRVPTTPTVGHSIHNAARRYSTIQQGFSFHLRTALARSSKSQFLPRAPTKVPRGIVQVGLGTARNFSSSRAIFQNLVENVPIAGRAIYEADLEPKVRQEREAMTKSVKGKSFKKQSGKEMLKPRARDFSIKENKPAIKDTQTENELEHYFTNLVVPDITTCLLIPLAPTPATRVPLPENPGSLLPLPTLASIHASHETHSLRVSTLFSRLDAANVWERGVQCSAFSHGGGADGVCTMLKVEFIGWTKAEVRAVLGESGTGWCVLEETKASANGLGAFSDYDDDNLSDTSSVLSGSSTYSRTGSHVNLTNVETVDPSQSLFLPTLDFSSSFLAASSPPLTPPHHQAASSSASSFVHSDSD
ncbi:hypothetical protein D9615_001945 [Tricholomella constricta]|uniref:Uncharacterized protein n=1 Tax=Tricholomella constricta TaxID=117010 RepID=A0A8H5HPP0_9AGAR|nr:hypothetical protein D9615_001945 [Tricholomella constricta]